MAKWLSKHYLIFVKNQKVNSSAPQKNIHDELLKQLHVN
jgi:hypothetical protein